jgi:hypothetical protein
MQRRESDGSLFECLDWILKKTIKDESFLKFPNIYLLNRWLSMSHYSIAQIINATTNRWSRQINEEEYVKTIARFYRFLLPRYTNHIKYIKKSLKNSTLTETDNFKDPMEISQREINLYNKLVEELKLIVK